VTSQRAADDADTEPFLRRHAGPLAAGLAASLVLAVAAYFFLSSDGTPPPRPAPELTIVNIIPPPPPPPPPPQEVQQRPEPEMIEQPKMEEPEFKPEEAKKPDEQPPEANNEPPPGPLGLDRAAEGPGDQFNLAGNPGGRGILGGNGSGGSRWGWYATIVTQQIESALRANAKTRNLVGQVQVRLWADNSGRITRVQLVTPSGDPEIDSLISNQILPGLTLREAPPTDMPMPIVTRISGRRTT
jgi:outer membrane biosynthesis protein TonB